MEMFGIASPFIKTQVETEISTMDELLDKQKKIKDVDKALESFFRDIDEYEITTPLDNYIKSLELANEETTKYSNLMMTSLKGVEDQLVNLFMTGSMNFKSLISSIIEDIIRYEIQAAITIPIAKALNEAMKGEGYSGGSFFGTAFAGIKGIFGLAQGGVVSGISSYRNSVVSTPTIVPNTSIEKFATGTAMFGEAGPEAILPLKRTSSGNLGVESTGNARAPVSIEMNVTNKTRQDVTAKQEGMRWDSASKKMIIGIILEAAQNNTGNFKTSMKQMVTS
jgi:phage-related minor tail protein